MSNYDLSLPVGFNCHVRLFPLDGLVLFPGIIQGLHIFEPRYRAMLEDALQHDSLITMAVAMQEENEHCLRPQLFSLASIGRVISCTKLDDGNYNILLLGLRRATIVTELPPNKPWRQAEVEIVRDVCIANEKRIGKAREDLLAAFRKLATRSGIDLEPFESVDPTQVPLGLLADTIAYSADLDVNNLLTILSKIDVVERSVAVVSMIQAKFLELETTPPQSGDVGFPPGFSLN